MVKLIEDNSKKSYSLSARANRYFIAPINWDSYPDEIILACRGTKNTENHFTKINCGTIKGFFVGEDKTGTPKPIITRCGQLSCNIDGKYIASKRAKKSAMRILASIRCTNWTEIKFISFNIQQSKSIKKMKNESYFEFLERKKKLEKFDFKKNEDFYSWLKRVKKIVINHALKSNIKGLAILFHADRLDNINFNIETRCWSPHFHIICFGKIENASIFFKKFGYNYSQQKPIKINNFKKLPDIAGRIAYRINHSAYSLTKKGNATHSISYAGDMGYRSLKEVDKTKNSEFVLTKSGEKQVAVKLNAVSEIPEFVIKKYNKNVDKAKFILDNKIHDYIPLKLERENNQILKQIYEEDLVIDKSWRSKPLDFLLNHNNEKYYLVEVEKLKKFRSLKTKKEAMVSSFEFIKNKKPHFDLLNVGYFDPDLEEKISILKKNYNNLEKKSSSGKILLTPISSYEKNFLEENPDG